MSAQENTAVLRPAAPFGLLAALLLLGSAALIMMALHHPLWPAGSGTPVDAIPAAKILDTEIVAPAPSPAFIAEAAMSPQQLMARWDPIIAGASHRFGVPQDWIRAVIRQESGGRTMLTAQLPMTSATGAMGVMQVMPGTYEEMRQQLGLGRDAYDPHDNIYAGTAYLKWLHRKYGYPAMFAAYNDGPGKLDDHLQRGRPLPAETRAYIRNIAKALGGKGFSLVALTRPDGTRFSIDAEKVSDIRAAEPGIYAPGVATVIRIGKTSQGVRENPGQVAALLRRHGAPV